jgi:DNA polymerase-3 subunit alpha
VPDSTQIRFGMAAIKNVGRGAVEEILRARQEGQFASLEDFLTRVSCRIVNRKTIESLIKAGALDRFGDRSTLLFNLDTLIAFAQRVQKQANSGQTDIFGNLLDADIHMPRLELQIAEAIEQRDQLLWERELLGLYLSQHPLELFETILSEQTIPLNSIKPEHDGKAVSVGGAITEVREITTKNGQKMAFVKIEDQFGEVEAILFPNSYQQTLGLWERDRVVLIRGKVNSRDKNGQDSGEVKIMVDDGREITSQQAAAYQATGKKRKTPKPNLKAVKMAPAPATW